MQYTVDVLWLYDLLPRHCEWPKQRFYFDYKRMCYVRELEHAHKNRKTSQKDITNNTQYVYDKI